MALNHPDVCWLNLVKWALFFYNFFAVGTDSHRPNSNLDLHHTTFCCATKESPHLYPKSLFTSLCDRNLDDDIVKNLLILKVLRGPKYGGRLEFIFLTQYIYITIYIPFFTFFIYSIRI
jgi:hypothetical protein